MNDTEMKPNTEIRPLIATIQTLEEDTYESQMVVTSRGALIKNRHGKTTPDNDLCCNLVNMVIGDNWVKLFFPSQECCDMTAAINLATCASPTVKYIQTWSGETQDTRYQKDGRGEWESRPVGK